MRLKLFCAALLALLLLSGCGEKEVIHSHEYEKEQVELSCAQDSGTRFVCDCGYSYMKVDVKAAGHQYEAAEVAAKGQLPAYTQYTCSVCGDTYQDSFEGELPTSPQASVPEDTKSEETEPENTEPEDTKPEGNEDTKPNDAPLTDSGEVMHFFDDAAFIGDSVSLKLQRYQAETGVFGSATFLTAGSYSVYHAINDSMFVSYRGQQMSPEDALAACGAKKVFILLGMNDIGRSDVGVDKTITNWAVFVQRIREKNPDIAIYIQSGTPIHAARDTGSLSNANMDAYNEKLKTFASQNNCQYIDIATVMKDENGDLKDSFCSDEYVHLSDEACAAWVSVLRNTVGG